MIEPHAVTISPSYRYRGGDPRGVRAQLEAVNTAAVGLGVPLPAGRGGIYEPDPAGDLQFIGESSITHTAEGGKLTPEGGTPFDLAAERRGAVAKRRNDPPAER